MSNILQINQRDYVGNDLGSNVIVNDLYDYQEIDITVQENERGPRGIGIPQGGNPGQILVKNSQEDFSVVWQDKPVANDGTLTIQKNGSTVQTFTANSDVNKTANIEVPTKTSELTNDSGFITSSSLPTVNDATLTIQKNGSDVATFTANSATNKTANITVPTKTSDLSNNSGFIDKDVNNLTYYTKTSDLPAVPTKTSELTNDGSDGINPFINATSYANASTGDGGTVKVGASWGTTISNTGYLGARVMTAAQYSDVGNGAIVGKGTLEAVLADKNPLLIRKTAISSSTNLSGLSTGIYPVNNIAHADFPVAGAMYGTLIQYPDTYKTQVLVAGEAAGGGNENNMYYRRWLTSTSSFTPWASTSITVDSALNASSTNPVENQALYPAIVPTEVYQTVSTSEWSGPAGTNTYNCVAILTLPSGTFTDNSLVELVNQDSFNIFAKHGFVLYGSEASSQRLWITSIGKPTGTVSFKFRIWKYGS